MKVMVDDAPARVAGIKGAVEVSGLGDGRVNVVVTGGVSELDEPGVAELIGALLGALEVKIVWDGDGNAHRTW